MSPSAEYQRAWRVAHPEKQGQYNKRFVDRHPEIAEQNSRRRVRHYRWMRLIKSVQGCLLCKTHEGTLTHHHVDPETKRYAVTQMYNCALKTILDEIAKCTVLCDRCHGRWHS